MITNLVNAMSQSSQFWWWSLFRSLLKESKIKMSSQAMSHMLCIGYGRFPPQNLTDLWLTIFRWGNVISKLKEDAKMIWGTYTFSEPIHDQNHIIYIKIPIQHDGWSDLLCHVSWACHQPYTGSNTSWSSISSSAYKSGLPSSIETNLDCLNFKKNITVKKILEFGLVTTPVPGETETGQTWPKVFDQIYAKIQY